MRIAYTHATKRQVRKAFQELRNRSLLSRVTEGKIEMFVPDHWSDDQGRAALQRHLPDYFISLREEN